MKMAAVDIGTNSTRLFIAEVSGKIKRLKKISTTTRLGEGVDKERRLNNEAIERNVNVLSIYKNLAESYGIRDINVIATSAVRDASNKDEFLNIIKSRTGIKVDIITGDEEAKLGFLGASSVLDGEMGVVIDIGGGSTEFICGIGDRINVSSSIDIGAVRITERYLNPNNLSLEDIERAERYIRDAIQGVIRDIKSFSRFTLVGIGGTITSLAAIDHKLVVYDMEKVHGFKLGKDRVDKIFRELSTVSLAERKNIQGIQPGREDILPAGTLILKIIMEELNSSFIKVSECDNLDGLLLQKYIQKQY